MADLLHPQPGLRRRLALMLLVVAALVLANIALFERLHWRIEDSAATLSRHVELYKLTRRVQVALEVPTAAERRALAQFRLQAADFDRDIERHTEPALGTGLGTPGNSEMQLLVEGLAYDWRAFQSAYAALRRFTGSDVPAALVKALDQAAEEVQASVIAINFTLQRERGAQFDRLQKSIYALAGVDLLVLALILVWLRRRVVEPVERVTAAARRLAAEDFSARVDNPGDDEIGELGRALNGAAARVEDLLQAVEHEADALREAEAKFRGIAEQSLTGIYLVQDSVLVYANPRLAAIFGYAADELGPGTPITPLVHPDDRALVREQIRRRLDGETASVRYEFRGLRRDGSIVPVEVLGALGSYRGRPAIIGSLVDLSERKHAESQIIKLSRAVEQSTASVIITDRDGRIEYVNPKFSELTGYAFADVQGQTPRLFASGQTPAQVYTEMWGSLLAGHEWHGEILNRKKSGELFWEHMVASPVRDTSGEITHFIAVKEDIGGRKQAELELRRANRTLQVLSACNQSLVHAGSPQALIETICRNLARLGGFPLACIGFPDDPEARSIRMVASAGPAADYAFKWSAADRGRGPGGEAIRRRECIICQDIASDPDYREWRDEAARYGLAASIALPLLHGGEVHGVLRIYSGEPGVFTADEVELLRELADDAAYGLHGFRTRDQLDAQAEQLNIRQRAIESSRNGVMITRCDAAADNPIIDVNPAFEKITGFSRGEVAGRNPRFLVGPFRDQPELDRLRDALRRGIEVEVTLRNVRRDGTMFWNELSLSPVHDGAGRVTHFISVLNDVSDRVRYQQELQHHVTHDTLTGLANRALLGDRIEQALAHASRSERKAAVLMLDLDRFKLINDSLGHPIGDELLRIVAERLSAVVRKGDTVARVGADEFVIVLAEIEDVAVVDDIADKIEAAFVPAFVIGGQEAFVSASVGISVAPDDTTDATTLLRHAEVAMYAAKGQGGDGHRRFATGMGEASADRIGLETDLRRGIERGELELVYQPKIRLRDGSIFGAEALIRWRHPERGLVPPLQFIPLAEETGLIGPIGDWVVAEALRHLRDWQDQGVPTTKIAVNLSARQFRDHGLVDRIRSLLDYSGVAAGLLELELTETMLMQRGEATVATLRELHGAGFSLAIDDFGTGYSSLSYLQRFPIDTLKIDRSFVMDLETSRDSRVLAETILMMARNLGKSVVAEGVETSGQADILQRGGCEVVQGYLFSRPVPRDEFTAMLRQGRLVPLDRVPA